jgi:hypothetical protein
MKQGRWFAGLLLAVAVLLAGGTAWAEHTPTARTSGQRSTGSRTDITVPYLTTGNSAFMPGYVQPKVYASPPVTAFGQPVGEVPEPKGGVAPRTYASPQVNDPANPQARPVYNIIFYGSVQGFGDRSNGAVPRSTPLTPR